MNRTISSVVRRCTLAVGFVFVTACASQSGQQHTNQTQSSASPSPAPESTASGSPAPGTASAAPAGDGSAAMNLPPMPQGLHGPATPWASMDASAKGHYMHDVVLPAMQSLFSAYDSHAYEHVTCATCHGANARAVHFHMPNSLPALFPFGSDRQREQFAAKPRLVAFMGERLVPVMAQLLGVAPFDMNTHQGFGCGGCHPHAN